MNRQVTQKRDTHILVSLHIQDNHSLVFQLGRVSVVQGRDDARGREDVCAWIQETDDFDQHLKRERETHTHTHAYTHRKAGKMCVLGLRRPITLTST